MALVVVLFPVFLVRLGANRGCYESFCNLLVSSCLDIKKWVLRGWFGQVEFAGVGCAHMKSLLPMTGTSELLGCLSPYIPDEFINEHWPSGRTGGRRRAFSAAQLWRTHLLVLLTPTHSVNLLLELLKEQRAWGRFAHLPNRQRVPDVRMLHQFRAEVGVSGLRKINEQLARSLLEPLSGR